MTIDLFTVAWNQEQRLQGFIDWYKPVCDTITIFDNHGTDLTATIASNSGCRVAQWGQGTPDNFGLRLGVKEGSRI